MKILVVFVG